jgi:hypothetical protein
MVSAIANPFIRFDTATAALGPDDIADDHSLLKIDQEFDFLMEQTEDKIFV